MTDLIQYDDGPRAVQHVPTAPAITAAAASLVSWAQEADAAYRLAEKLVATAFCPMQYKNKPAEAAAAMLAGMEVGLSPMASMKAFDNIQGTAAPKAITMRAVAQSRGAQFVTESSTPTKVVMRARRLGGEWERTEWTIERAAALGLAQKEQWKKQPETMLIARATSDLARRVASDALLGIPYSAEELHDGDAPVAGELAAPGRVTAAEITARRTTPDVDAPPALEQAPTPVAQPVVETPAEPPAPPITATQSRAIYALLTDNGITQKELGVALLTDVTGRPVESTKELTKVEASKVIAHLEAMKNNTPDDEGIFDAAEVADPDGDPS